MVTLILSLFLAAAAAPTASPAAKLTSAPSLAAAQKEARAKSRPLLLGFRTRWCGWCKKMDRDALRDPTVVDLVERGFVYLDFDAEDGATGSKLASQLRIRSYPTFMIVEPDLREVKRLGGYRPANAFAKALDDALRERRALAALRKRAAEKPRDAAALFELAQALERAKQTAEATPLYEQVVGFGPGRHFDLALWNLASLLKASGEHARALAAYERFLGAYPEDDRAEGALFEVASLKLRVGDPKGAVATFERFLAQYPNSRFVPSVRVHLAKLQGS